jgi:hypothetical protein
LDLCLQARRRSAAAQAPVSSSFSVLPPSCFYVALPRQLYLLRSLVVSLFSFSLVRFALLVILLGSSQVFLP